MIWWATQPSRARQERAAIANLEETAPWLSNVRWGFSKSFVLSADFEIVIDGNALEFTIIYPEFFPDAPPSIKPLAEVRISGHQYGAGGDLCLEYRADNWAPAITGAMMIESTYRLISGELDPQAEPVPSAHRTTLGQEVRASFLRLLLSSGAQAALASLPERTPLDAALVEHQFGETWIACPIRIGGEENPTWSEPAPLSVGTSEHHATALRLAGDALCPSDLELDGLQEFLATQALPDWLDNTKARLAFLLIADRQAVRLFMIYGGPDNRSVLEYTTINLPDPKGRLPGSYQPLTEKIVGIVGCGSVGGKVATALARTGVRRFLLIDPDIFLPDNVVRNQLDLRAVGVTKVRALKQCLLEVNKDCEVVTRAHLLGGQESNSSFASAMSALGDCDLIVDATASPDVFNLCAAISRSERKPMVWGSVYGGGIGGLIARVRPDIDPIPLAARNQIDCWYADQGKPWPLQEGPDYGGEGEGGAPLIASDADVSVIAAHLARLAFDTLLTSENSNFPASAYAVGLSAEWIFAAPFDTWPITLTPEGTWGPVTEENLSEGLEAFLSELLPPEESDAS